MTPRLLRTRDAPAPAGVPHSAGISVSRMSWVWLQLEDVFGWAWRGPKEPIWTGSAGNPGSISSPRTLAAGQIKTPGVFPCNKNLMLACCVFMNMVKAASKQTILGSQFCVGEGGRGVREAPDCMSQRTSQWHTLVRLGQQYPVVHGPFGGVTKCHRNPGSASNFLFGEHAISTVAPVTSGRASVARRASRGKETRPMARSDSGTQGPREAN